MALRLQTIKPVSIGTILEKYKVLSFNKKNVFANNIQLRMLGLMLPSSRKFLGVDPVYTHLLCYHMLNISTES